jgi:hypothetical protein
MYKKLISSILIVAILNLVGCYSSEFITGPDFDKIEKDAPRSIRVVTKDAEEYHFSQPNFYFVEDTLYGKEKLAQSEELVTRKIALSDIELIEAESFDLGDTCLYSAAITFGVSAVIALVVIIICAADEDCPPK